jgi:hypothetical protein
MTPEESAEQLSQTVNQLNAALNGLARAIDPSIKSIDSQSEASTGSAKAEAENEKKKAKATKLGVESAVQLAKVFTSAAGAMYKGEKGMSAFNGSVDAAAGSLIALAGVVAVMTGGVSLFTAGLVAAIAAGAEYVKASAEQSDKLYDAFQDISRAGAAGADGLQGVYSDMQKFGLGIQDLGKMSELLKSNSQSLALFGGTVFQGRKRFADLSGAMEPFRASLMNAGMSQDEINEGTAGYLRLQSRLGTTQNQTTEQLAEGTRKYLLEQEALTKVTGLSRKDQEALREKVMAQERFAGKQAELRAQGMGKAAEQLQETFIQLTGAGATDLAEGFADITAGNLTSAAAIKAYNSTNGEALAIAQKVSSGQINAAQATDMLRDATERQMKSSNAAGQAMIGVYDQTKGSFSQSIQFTSKGANSFGKAMDGAKSELEKQGATGKKAADAELQRQTDLRLTQQRAMMNMQDFVRNGVEPATKALSWFGETVEYITSMLPGSGDARQKAQEKTAFEKNKRAAEEQNQIILDAMARQKSATNKEELAAAKEAEKNAREKRQLLDKERDELLKTSKNFTGTVSTTSGYLQKMIQAESGGRNIANQSGAGGKATSSAYGVAQITKGTFEGLTKQAGEGNPLKGKTFEDMKGDVNLQMEAAQQLTDKNRKMLQSYGVSTSDAALYLAHFLGPSGAVKVLSQPDGVNLQTAGVSASQIAANPMLQKMSTVGDLKKWADAKMGGSGFEVAKYEDGGMLNGVGLVGEKGPELAVGAGSITSNTDIMGAFRMMTAELSAQSMILSEIARATKSSSTTSEKMLRYAQN